MLRPVFDVFIEYRRAPIAISLDLKAMYYSLNYIDQSTIFQFLSQNPNEPKSPIMVYQFIVGVMGAKSTQFLALMCLEIIAQNIEKTKPKIAHIIRSGYSDNLFIFADDVENANILLHETISVLEKYSFHCHEIFSENKDALNGIPESKLSKRLHHSLFEEIILDDTSPIIKTPPSCLGMKLNIKDNKCFIDYTHWPRIIENRQSQIFSKRKVASLIASCFSVDNILAPITYYGKAALNLIWRIDRELQDYAKQLDPSLTKSQLKKHSISWDDDLHKVEFPTEELKTKFAEVQKLWEKFEIEIAKLKSFYIPRYIFEFHFNTSDIKETQLITMSDCGKLILAALAYLKIILANGNVLLGLVACKSRVRNELTIAKGELLALLDSTMLANK